MKDVNDTRSRKEREKLAFPKRWKTLTLVQVQVKTIVLQNQSLVVTFSTNSAEMKSMRSIRYTKSILEIPNESPSQKDLK